MESKYSYHSLKHLLFLITVYILGLGTAKTKAQSLQIDFRSNDGFELTGDFYNGAQDYPGILLIHSCNVGQRADYIEFAELLNKKGFHVLSFDFRGHGDSRIDQLDAYSDKDLFWKNENGGIMKDIRAAMKFMNSKIGSNSKIGVVGSSCGVKRAIMLASENENIAALVLMSGGTNKEGLQLVRDSNLPIYCLAAHDDGDGIASQWCDELFLASPNENSRKLIFKTGGHGAELLASQINLNEELVSWFKENLQ